jgi:PAS domain S-box-containing protein
VGISLAYFVSYVLLERFTVNPQIASGPSVWYPPAGLTFALLVGGGPWYLPVVVITLTTSEYLNLALPIFSPFGAFGSLITAVGYTIGSIVLRRQLRSFDPAQAVRSVTCYVITACLSSLGVAMLGTTILTITLGRGWASYWQFVFYWWIGDGVALLCIAPFLLVFVLPRLTRVMGFAEPAGQLRTARAYPWNRWKALELAAQVVGTLSIFAILIESPLSRHSDLFYLFFLPVMWIAIAHGLPGAVTASLVLNIGLITLYPATIATPDVLIKVHLLQFSIAVAGMFLGASITERETVRAQLSKRTTYFEELISHNPIPTLVYDPQGKFQLCNPAFEKLFQFQAAEIAGKMLLEVLVPRELWSESIAVSNRAVAGEAVHFVTRRKRKDGTPLEVAAHVAPLNVSGEMVGVLALYEDLTERKRLEAQVQLSGKLQAVGRLAGGVAHDFNNIIGVIQGYAELLLERLPADGKLRSSAEEILQSSQRATRMTRQLLAFSRKQVVQLQVLDLNSIVLDFKTMLLRLLPEDITQVFIPGPQLGRIRFDKGQMEQVIMNLVVNARDAMPQGGVLTIETFDTVMTEAQAALELGAKPGAYVVLSVKDTGIGMDAATKELIFDPFFSTKDKDKGTGLGLATVYGIVHHAEGFITVDSTPGQGSTFRVYLPQVEAALDVPAVSAEEPLRGGTETILLAEDEPALRDMIRMSLESSGYTVLEASDGAQAVEVAQRFEGRIDLLLTDVIMPRMRGPQTAKYLSFLRPGIKTIFMSGYTDGAVEKADFLQENPVFLQKPFLRAALGQKIREVLESSDAPVGAK